MRRPNRSSSGKIFAALEKMEPRRLLAANTPFTIDGHPWEILANSPSWVEGENFDYGGQNVAYKTNNSNNPGGQYRINEQVGIEGPSANTGGTYNTGYSNGNNWLKYSVTVDQAGSYVVNLHASTAGTQATAHVAFDGGGNTVSTGTLTIPNTGGWGDYKDFTATVTLVAGAQNMTVYDDSGQYNIDYISLTPAALAGSAEQAYSPQAPGSATNLLMRDIPTLLPAFGGTQIESEYFDFGGEAAGATGVQTAGYYWPTPNTAYADYPYTANPFRATDTVNTSDSGSGIVTTNWLGGNWTQYSLFVPTDIVPLNLAATTASYQPVTLNRQYQLLFTYSNSGTTTSNFTIGDTNNGAFTQVGTLSLVPTSGNYQTISTIVTLPGTGLNVLRFTDADTTGANSHVNFDYFRMLNSTTTGNNGAPWDIPASGTTTHIPADDYDAAPGSANFTPSIVPTTDTVGTENDIQNFTTNNSLTYTISADLTGQYLLNLRVKNTGATAATLQVTFDSGAAFGGPNDPVTYTLNVSTNGGAYQTVSTATDTSQLPQTTNPWVAIQEGPQHMLIKVLSGTLSFHWVELSKITTVAVDKPDATQSGSYAAEPPDAAMNSVGDLFDRVYNTSYDWINPPANAPVPTNDWWTNILTSQFAGDMYVYPQKLNDSATGVAFSSYNGVGANTAGNTIIQTGQQSVVFGATSTSFTEDALLDYGDWTVHYRMLAAAGSMDVTMGRGIPYTWYEYNSLTPTITLHTGSDANQNAFTIYDGSGNVQSGTFTADHFRVDTGAEQIGVFAPAGTTFTRSGSTFTVTYAAGVAHYLVAAVLPDSSAATLNLFYQHAYAIPRQVGSTPSSKYTWSYNAAAGQVVTNWNLNMVAIDPANPPSNLNTIEGWLPIDYSNGATPPTVITNASNQPYIYPSINGNIEFSIGTSFAVTQTTTGINFELALPQIIGAPTVAYDPSNPTTTMVSTDYSPQQMLTYIQTYIQQNTNTAASQAAGTTILNYGNDTYWGGKPLQEYAEFALMAKQIGDVTDMNILVSNLATIMTNWFTYTPGESQNYFAYYPSAHALIGFNPAYGSENFTDNHFHYGYFTSAAGVLCMLDPAWAAQYGSMAKMVAMQYANWLHPGDTPDLTDPNAESLPFLRTFEPWVGHSYAGGTGSGGGNNQESSSEAIQSWLGIVLLGQALNDPTMTAAGMMGYTMESKAIQEQWFNQAPGAPDPNGIAFPSSYKDPTQSTTYSNVAINFDGGKDYATYFGANPEYILGIEALPLWPDLDYLGENAAAAAAATQSMLNERVVFFNNPADNTFASFESGGENDWLNIALGFQAQYNPQATALEYARMIAQQTPTGVTGSTGLYYFQDHSYQTYGNRDYNYHLSIPLGGVYTHGTDSTAMSNTRTYMAYNVGSTNETVNVYDANGNLVDSFTAVPGFNVVTRSTVNGGHAPPIFTTGAASTPSTVTGTTAQLSVLATDETQTESNITYTWSMIAGPTGANPVFTPNGTNVSKNTTVTFNMVGTYTFQVLAHDSNGLSMPTQVTVIVTPTLSQISVSPNPATMFPNATQVFTASGNDQFGYATTSSNVTWSIVSGGGTINATTGSYKAPGSTGTASVMATATGGSATAAANITIITQLQAPATLQATYKSGTEEDLSWTASTGATGTTGYYIYRGTTVGGESTTPLNSTAVTTTTYNDTTASPYTTYFYIVKAVNTGGTSAASNEASGTTSPDLALNRPAYVSASENNTTTGNYAVDGSDATRWSSAFSDPQWIDVDLGSVKSISEIKLNWENAAGKNYLLQVSSDTTEPAPTSPDWTTVVTVVGNTTSGWKDYQNLNTTGRWVQMYGTVRTGVYGYSLWDLSVYAPPPVSAVTLTGSNYLELDSSVAGQLDCWSGTTNTGSPTHTYALSSVSTITDTASSATDSLTVDFSRGNPLGGTSAGMTWTGVTGGSDAIIIVGDNAGDTFTTSAGKVQVSGGSGGTAFSAVPINFTKTATVTITAGSGNDTYHQTAAPGAAVSYDLGAGTDTVTLDNSVGNLTVAAPSGTGTPIGALQSLSIGSGDKVTFASAPGHSGRSLLQTNTLSFVGSSGNWQGQLDLQSNDLIVLSGSFANLYNQVLTGYNAGSSPWTGQGIISSTAAGSSLNTLAVLLNNTNGSTPLLNTFDGHTPIPATDMFVKYTYFGDADLSGNLTGNDYTLIDGSGGKTGWSNGDFNYDGHIDGSDYSLLDNAFNQQGASLAAEIASQVAVPAVSTATDHLARAVPQETVAVNSSTSNSDVGSTIDETLDNWQRHRRKR
jgi:endoglucanase Acf2